MPHNISRTGKPGNSSTYRPINIKTAHPEKLALQEGPKPVPSPETFERAEPGEAAHDNMGRSGRPGNTKSYQPIHIRTPEPDMLSPTGGPAVVASPAGVPPTKDVPSRRSGKTTGTKKYTG